MDNTLKQLPEYLRELEIYYRAKKDNIGISPSSDEVQLPPALIPYAEITSIARILTFHSLEEEEANFANLSPAEIRLYFTLTRQTEPQKVSKPDRTIASEFAEDNIQRNIERRRRLDLSSATDAQKLTVYKETIESMINFLYSTSLAEITDSVIDIFSTDLREMIFNFRKIDDRPGISQIKAYLEQAQIKITLAAGMSVREEEISKTRLENKYAALLECRQNLENALDFLQPLVAK